MKPRLVYVVGPPGSGKSTLMAGLTEGYVRLPSPNKRLPMDELYWNNELVAAELGKRRGSFSGTDALSMNIHPLACEFIAHRMTAGLRVIFGEGQRLGTVGFLEAAVKGGRDVDLIWLDPPAEVAAARRAARGSMQQESWIKGATTRAGRLALASTEMPGVRLTRVADHGSSADTAARLRTELRLDLEVKA